MNDNKEIVSVIIPCYNGGQFLDRCLESIIRQSYKKIELIIVNDGSTDKSNEIIESKMPEMKSQLLDCKYIEQENLGVGGGSKYCSKVCHGGVFNIIGC